MTLVNAVIGAALVLVVLGSSVEPVQAAADPSGPCCVCTLCDFSEHCFTGVALNESVRCTDLCGEADCRAGQNHVEACETFTLLCEVITPAPAETQAAPAMHPLALVVAAIGTALVGCLGLARSRRSKTGLPS